MTQAFIHKLAQHIDSSLSLSYDGKEQIKVLGYENNLDAWLEFSASKFFCQYVDFKIALQLLSDQKQKLYDLPNNRLKRKPYHQQHRD
jgi:hypothetical protein